MARLIILLSFLSCFCCSDAGVSTDSTPSKPGVAKPGYAPQADSAIIAFRVDPRQDEIRFHYRDSTGRRFANFGSLRQHYAAMGEELRFAVNGGMFHPGGSPVGLYVEKGKRVQAVNRDTTGRGNFFLWPNGIFAIGPDATTAVIIPTGEYSASAAFRYATQSGPLLLDVGQFHPAIREGSPNLRTRNGVGILPNGDVLFAHATEPINFYDFATYFRERGCRQALYLDGVISETYAPELGRNSLEGDFGVMIGVAR